MPVIQIDQLRDGERSKQDVDKFIHDRVLLAKLAHKLLDKYGFSSKAKGVQDHLDLVESSSNYGVKANHVNAALVKSIQGLNALILTGVHEKLTDPCIVVARLLEILGEDG